MTSERLQEIKESVIFGDGASIVPELITALEKAQRKIRYLDECLENEKILLSSITLEFEEVAKENFELRNKAL